MYFGCCWLSCQYLLSDWLERLLCIKPIPAKTIPTNPGRRAFMTFWFSYCIISFI